MYMTKSQIHSELTAAYIFMTMQYRLSLNSRKYIQLLIKNPKVHLIERHQFMSLNVLVHVKPSMFNIVFVATAHMHHVSECL